MRLDYIQEELARQQLALAALLRGQAVWEKRKAEVAPDLQSQTLIKRGQTSAVSDWERFLEGRTIKEAEPVPIIQTGDAEKTVLRSEKGSLFHAAERRGRTARTAPSAPAGERRMGLGRSCSRSCEHGVGDGA